jgi:hypothetical protein
MQPFLRPVRVQQRVTGARNETERDVDLTLLAWAGRLRSPVTPGREGRDPRAGRRRKGASKTLPAGASEKRQLLIDCRFEERAAFFCHDRRRFLYALE